MAIKLSKYLLLLLISTVTTVSASDVHINLVAPQQRVIPREDVEIEAISRDYFIGLSAGLSMFSIDENLISGSLTLDRDPKDSAATYGLEFGYYFDKNIFVTINYEKAQLENIHFDTLYASINYQFTNYSAISPYLGIILGYNMMHWDEFPIDASVSDSISISEAWGFQVGDDIVLKDDLKFFIGYKYLWLDNKTVIVISPNKEEITHKHEQSINVGFKFTF